MEHIVQFGINLDDSAILKTIETQALNYLRQDILKEFKSNLPHNYSGYTDWRGIAADILNDFIEENKDKIIEMVVARCYDSITRTKKYKEAVSAAIEKGSTNE